MNKTSLMLFGIFLTMFAQGFSQDNEETESYILNKRCYELRAPSLDKLKEARGKLDRAVDQFRKHFGQYPPKIAVIIFESIEEMEGYDFSQFTKKRMPYLPWIVSNHTESHREVNHLPEEYKDHKAGCGINHEAGHMFLFAYIEKKAQAVINTAKNSKGILEFYGHPALPDWYDEAVAQLCETDANQHGHISFMKNNIDKHIPLKKFLEMEHPSLQMILKPNNADEESKEGPKYYHTLETPENLEEELIFYAQAFSVAKFLIERKSEGLIGKMAIPLAEGKSIQDVFKINKLDDNIETIEKNWVDWVKTQKD
ncbi:MAG: hypothetical protein HY606_06855 [Planctomycetes bacterium]|nr:hypothetical protein [Planctomycetota bacterium]